MNIGVLFGGISVEHDISIISAIQVIKALDKSKYQVIPIYITKQGEFLTGKRYGEIETYKNPLKPQKSEYVNLVRKNSECYLSYIYKKFKNGLKIDLILPIMHGKGVEDGNISGFLEILNIPYISSKTLGASIMQDKEYTKIFLKENNINTLEYQVFKNKKYEANNKEYPLIIKPASLGSSIGISKVNNDYEYEESINQAFKYDNKIIVEKCLTNFKEYSIALYKYKNELKESQIEEIKFSGDIYRFIDKYQSGTKVEETNHQLPAKISNEVKNEIINISKNIYSLLDLKGVVRVDFLYDNVTNKLYVNEVNTIPGSLGFYLFNISFKDLLDELIKECLMDYNKQKELIEVFNSSVLVNNTLKQKK